MCLMCEEEAFFRAYWDEALARQRSTPAPDAARFAAVEVTDAAAPTPAAAAADPAADKTD